MSAKNSTGRVDARLVCSGGRAKNQPLLGRKSLLMGMLTSGFVIANAGQASAGTIKPIAATQPAYITKWAPYTTYARGQQVICPNNDVVSANVAHTSVGSYATDTAKWAPSSTWAQRPDNGTRAVGKGELAVNVKDYGAVADCNGMTGTDNTAAFTAAVAATPAGGKLYIPSGRYYFAGNFPAIAKPIEMSGATTGLWDHQIGTQLVFAAGRSGPSIASTASAGGWYVHDLELQSRSTVAGSDVGFFASGGYGTLTRVSVNAFGSHGVHFKAGSNYGGGNANNSILERVRAYGNLGDGIRIEGSDANAMLLTKSDVVANRGYGINIESASMCKIVHPHADQQYGGSPGAFRDSGISNDWDWVYSEAGAPFLIDTNSSHGRLTTTYYAAPELKTVGLGYRSWQISQDGVAYRAIYVQGANPLDKLYRLQSGNSGVGSFDLINDTDGKTLLTIDGAATRAAWSVDLNPSVNGAQSLGTSSTRWQAASFSSWVRVGAVATSSRPSAASALAGAQMYDTTLRKPIWSDGTLWRDANGTAV